MTLPKLLAVVALFLFSLIGFIAIVKRGWSSGSGSSSKAVIAMQSPIEVALEEDSQILIPAKDVQSDKPSVLRGHPATEIALPDADRIEELFNKQGPNLPIVETVTYHSRVPWLKGRPAWLSDYASHYGTSRHFIARSLNGKADYAKQNLSEGDRFNVLSKDKNFEFYLVVDTSRCKMWFYYVDLDTNKATLIKTYRVGLGRLDPSKTSGLLTPLGKYTLGDRVAIFKAKGTGMYQGKKIEMITVFGTRWIPFESEIENCTAPAKGFGIHGTPWTVTDEGNTMDEGPGLGKYESDGCIRLATADIEELFSIIISRPTTIEIVRDFSESTYAK